jgi:hypothetical protein
VSGTRRVRDFQKTDPHLRSHPSFLKFKRRLGCSATMAHGILAGLWSFAFAFSHDGDISRFSGEDLELALEWDIDGETVMKALEGCFIEKGVIKDWAGWGGALFSERDSEARRKWDERKARKDENTRNPSEQESMSADISGQYRTMPRREEKRRELTQEDLKPLSPRGDAKKKSAPSQELAVLEGEVVEDDLFEDLFWPSWPNRHGSKKTAKARFNAASALDQQRILIAEGHLIATIADGRYEMEFLPRAENFVGGQKSFFEEWAAGPPAKYCRGNGGSSKKQRDIDLSIARAVNDFDWPEEAP